MCQIPKLTGWSLRANLPDLEIDRVVGHCGRTCQISKLTEWSLRTNVPNSEIDRVLRANVPNFEIDRVVIAGDVPNFEIGRVVIADECAKFRNYGLRSFVPKSEYVQHVFYASMNKF
ncbi:unnamed protein product [Toxocara canis]|uniref:ATP-dependent DNA helicase n=1 Tax=Toxocara canis TaxID=6265 RepID=A0A183VBB9_TOXCA|nr:unnamed protein product [Toxocara canis]